MTTLVGNIIGLLIVSAMVFFPLWLIVWWVPWHIERAYRRERMYGNDKPIFKLKKGVLLIDWKTFGLNGVKRFLARHFPKVVIILDGGKELYFYKGIQGKIFTYEGKLSYIEELQYDAIKEHI